MRTIEKFTGLAAALTLGVAFVLLTATRAAAAGYGLASFDGSWSCSASFSDGRTMLFDLWIPQVTSTGSITGTGVSSDSPFKFTAQVNLSEIMADGSGVITVGTQSSYYQLLPSAIYFTASSDGFIPAPAWTGLAGQWIKQAGSMNISGVASNPQTGAANVLTGDCERQ